MKMLFDYYRKIKKYLKLGLLSSSTKRLIEKNKQFNKLFEGKRCFVLGNGPSLNEFDLQLLSKEYVFCVNEFVKFPKIEIVHPDCYLLADPKFFNLDIANDQDLKLINQFRYLAELNPDLQLFIPFRAKNTIDSYSLHVNLNYFYIYGSFDADYSKPYDFSGFVPSMQAVVQYAILLAVYMGFKKIYMLGTEQTNIFGNIRAFMQENEVSEYAFEMSDEEKKRKNEKLTTSSLTKTLRGYARIFELYEELGRYCENLGVELVNCSPNTLIQGIKKGSFIDIFKE